jgi:hypothetical protein
MKRVAMALHSHGAWGLIGFIATVLVWQALGSGHS